MKIHFKKLLLAVLAFSLLFNAGCRQNIKTAESPEEVVKKFYAYVKEGGPTTLGEAYRLIDAKLDDMDESKFKELAAKYSKDMDIKVIGSTVDAKNGVAIVKIALKVPSSFGGYVDSETEVRLTLDRDAKAWKIDLTGETSEENPLAYKQ